MRASRTAGLVVLLVLCGCGSSGDTGGTAVRDPDGGAVLDTIDASIPAQAVPDERRPATPDPRLECTFGFAPFLCQGDCPGGLGCCITQPRPTGVCRTLDACAEQCELDCAIEAMTRGPLAGMRCESVCTWLSPEPSCRPSP